MKFKGAMGAVLLAASCWAGYEDGMYRPEWVEDGEGREVLSFDKAVTMYGLVTANDPATGNEFYAGLQTLKIAKTSRGMTKWASAVTSGTLGNQKVSKSESLSSDDMNAGASQKGFWMSTPVFDWFPLGAWGDFEKEGGLSGYTSAWIYDGKQKGLAVLKGGVIPLAVFAPDDGRTTVVNLIFGAQGKVKVSAWGADGRKAKAAPTFVVGFYGDQDSWSASVPVYLQMGDACIGFYVSLNCENGSDWYFETENATYYSPQTGARSMDVSYIHSSDPWGDYSVDAYEVDDMLSEYVESLNREDARSWTEAYLLSDYLFCETVTFGKKVTTPKAASVKLKKYSEDGDVWFEPECSNWENPMGLKMTYKAKTGEVKGSLTAYVVVVTYKIKSVREDGETVEREIPSASLKKVSLKFSGTADAEGAVLTVDGKKFGGASANVYLYSK